MEKAMEAMAYNPDKALNIIDSAYIVGNIPDFMADILRMKVYSQSLEEQRLDSTFELGERLLRHDSVSLDPRRRLTVLDLLVNASNLSSNDEMLLKWTEQEASVCRELGDDTEALRTEADRGAALSRLGHLEEGLKLIDNVINSLDGIRKFREMDTWIIAVRRKINILETLPGTGEQIAALSRRILTRLEDYSQNPETYKDGSTREPGESERPAYIEFYQSKCYAYLANVFADTDQLEARRYLTMYENTANGRTYTGRTMIAPILCKLGEYDRMEEIYRQMDAQRFSQDSLSQEYLTMLHNRAEAAEAQGRTADALSLWKRYDALKGLAVERSNRGNTYLYSSRYEAEQLQNLLKKEQAQKARIINLAWFLGIVTLLLLVCGVLTLVLRGKNTSQQVLDGQALAVVPRVPKKALSEMDDEALFSYIDGIIRRDKLFLDPMLNRETLMKRIKGLSAHRIGAAFSKGSTFKSLPGYVRNLRMEYAGKLLLSRPDLSVKAVGEASGFSNNSTFCTEFKAFYGASPSAYRKEKQAD